MIQALSEAYRNRDVYLNTAACGLIGQRQLDVMQEFHQAVLEIGNDRADLWRNKEAFEIKTTVAEFLGTESQNVAFIPNFSYGFFALTQSLKPRRKVLLYQNDYTSMTLPFKLGDFGITWFDSYDDFRLEEEEIEHLLLVNNIEILAISHVQWLSGFTLDIDRIGRFCMRHNILFLVDATQSMGARNLSFDHLPCDALIASCYKWMNAGYGLGIMCLKPEFIQQHKPLIGGYGSFRPNESGEWQFSSGIPSYEPGHLNMAGFLALKEAILEKNKLGMDEILLHNHSLINRLIEGMRNLQLLTLGEEETGRRTGIVCFQGDDKLLEELHKRDLRVSLRNGFIRVSPHFYNSSEDIDTLLNALEDIKA